MSLSLRFRVIPGISEWVEDRLQDAHCRISVFTIEGSHNLGKVAHYLVQTNVIRCQHGLGSPQELWFRQCASRGQVIVHVEVVANEVRHIRRVIVFETRRRMLKFAIAGLETFPDM